MTTQSTAKKLAATFGCALDVEYTKTGGYSITLDAPEGKAFKHSGASCDCNIFGNGLMRSEMNWDACCDSIRASCAAGFEDCVD